MRIAVLGAAGIIGRDIARRLAEDSRLDLLLADRREDAVRNLAKRLHAEGTAVDVSDVAQTVGVLNRCDFVLNATLYYFNLKVMDACLRAGCDYLDLGGLYHTTRKQLALDGRFQAAGLLAVLGCGKAPGITNVLAAWGAPRFERLDAVRLRSGRRPLEPATGITFPYSPQTLFDELTLDPVVLEGRELREIGPLSRRETVRHPEPFGEIEYVATLHSELATLPKFLGRGLREMDFKVALAPETSRALERLIGLGLASTSPVEVDGRHVIPRDVTAAVLAELPPVQRKESWITEVEMIGQTTEGPQSLLLRVTGDETQNGTSIGAIVGADLVRRSAILKKTGVCAPETVLPPEEFLRGLSQAGLRVTETLVEQREVSG